ncbi:MAG: DUF2799 domain-containing protein [Moraxella sp.]|nr:DUF2799 domain-containing protein [Moraxella sp.]
MKRVSIVLVLSLLSLSGCLSTGMLKAHDCPNTDWKLVGYQDGINGESAQKILRHARTCQGHNPPNRALWEAGRQEGLNKYCTKTNAYNLGRMGRTLNAVCEDNLETLHQANIMGLQQYEISERINRLSYGYGHLEPWLLPYYLYWF